MSEFEQWFWKGFLAFALGVFGGLIFHAVAANAVEINGEVYPKHDHGGYPVGSPTDPYRQVHGPQCCHGKHCEPWPGIDLEAMPNGSWRIISLNVVVPPGKVKPSIDGRNHLCIPTEKWVGRPGGGDRGPMGGGGREVPLKPGEVVTDADGNANIYCLLVSPGF